MSPLYFSLLNITSIVRLHHFSFPVEEGIFLSLSSLIIPKTLCPPNCFNCATGYDIITLNISIFAIFPPFFSYHYKIIYIIMYLFLLNYIFALANYISYTYIQCIQQNYFRAWKLRVVYSETLFSLILQMKLYSTHPYIEPDHQ